MSQSISGWEKKLQKQGCLWSLSTAFHSRYLFLSVSLSIVDAAGTIPASVLSSVGHTELSNMVIWNIKRASQSTSLEA